MRARLSKSRGYVYSQGKCVIEVISAFLYRDHFSDYQNTFETTEEPDYLILIDNNAAVGVSQSKKCSIGTMRLNH
jgi:fatty acid synthase subunit beta